MCCHARVKADKDLTAEVRSENKTLANPVTVNEETNVSIREYALKYAYYALFHRLNGLIPLVLLVTIE